MTYTETNSRFGDISYTPDKSTTILLEYLRSTPEWRAADIGQLYDLEGTERYKLRSGAANLVRYTKFYLALRSEYIALSSSKPFSVWEIAEDLTTYLNRDYNIETQDAMAAVYLILSKEIERRARSEFLESPERFPQTVINGGPRALDQFLLNFIDLVISDLGPAPYRLRFLIRERLAGILYYRALKNEVHEGFFAFPIMNIESQYLVTRAK